MNRERAAKWAEYALGLLDPSETRALDLELEESERARTDLRETVEALELLALDTRPIAPPDRLEAKILASSRSGPGRFEGFIRRLSTLFDLPEEGVRSHLHRIAERPPRSDWIRSPYPGIWLYDLDGGPATAGADCGFVYVEAGVEFPSHRHLGREDALVLAGEARTLDGEVWLPGSRRSADTADRHGFRAVGDRPFVFAARLAGPIQPD